MDGACIDDGRLHDRRSSTVPVRKRWGKAGLDLKVNGAIIAAMTPEQELAWLAGLLEGEASFTESTKGQKRKGVHIRVRLNMTDYDIVERAVEVAARLGFGRVNINPRKAYNERCKPQWIACWTSAKAEKLMIAILPFMGERRSGRIREILGAREKRMVWHIKSMQIHELKKSIANDVAAIIHNDVAIPLILQ